MLARLALVTILSTTSCLITNPTEFVPERPLTPPRIRDLRGITRPRLGNLIELRETDTALEFSVPVDDSGINDPLQWKVFINSDRDCIPDDTTDCEARRSGEVAANSTTQRFVRTSFRESFFSVGCNRVELWVSSSFMLDGDRHTPTRPGDVDSASWWVFKRAAGMSTTDPIEDCAHRVQP